MHLINLSKHYLLRDIYTSPPFTHTNSASGLVGLVVKGFCEQQAESVPSLGPGGLLLLTRSGRVYTRTQPVQQGG